MDEAVDRKWRALSEEILTDLKAWRQAHPKATFREIEQAVHERTTWLEAQLLEDTAQASAGREWSVRQACLDHLLILEEKQLQRVLNAYVAYFNQARPHQGIAQHIPQQRRSDPFAQDAGNKVIALPVMGGLHHDYRKVA